MAHKLWTVIEQLKECQQPTPKKSEFDLEGRDACASIEKTCFQFLKDDINIGNIKVASVGDTF